MAENPEELDREALKRSALFVPCTTKKALHNWIKVFLGLDIPDCIVDPESNSSPMHMLFEVYSKAQNNDDPDFSRVLYWACRDGFKCSARGTKILTCTRGLVPIEEIELGETIWSGWNWRPVTDWIHDGVKDAVTLTILPQPHLSIKEPVALTVSPIHRVWAWRNDSAHPEWVRVSELKELDVVRFDTRFAEFRDGGWQLSKYRLPQPSQPATEQWAFVGSVTKGTADFYDLTVEDDHSYWSNGFISHNTLCASILEVLSLVHLGRDVAHMAAIEAQATKAQNYVKGFLQKPYLRDFVVGDNKRETWVVRYHDKESGTTINERDFQALPPNERNAFEEIRQYVVVVICSLAGANGSHVPLFITDEIDVVRDPRAYEESKLIPAPINGLMPITVLVSTRKFAFGLVQKEIDEAKDTGLQMRHWNLIDVTEACPPERHLPDQPRLLMYRSDDELKAVIPEIYETFTEDRKKKYTLDENTMAGCATCKLFPACKGYLATKQTSKSKLLKPINHTINQFRTVSIPTAKAQLLCKKPSSEGLIYPQLDRDIHGLTAAEMASKITGEEFKREITKEELIRIMKDAELKFHAGMDFGYSHNFAVAAGSTDGYRAYMIGGISQAELDPVQQVEICNKKLRYLDPQIYADPENPQMAKFLKKAGFRMKEWKKGAGSVMAGIDIVRSLLRPAIGDPRFFFLKDDEDCELIFKRLSQYHWKLDPDGRIGKTPDDADDDECFIGETEVLTHEHGWVRMDEIQDDVTVMAIAEDGTSRWEKPSYILRKQYKGSVFVVDNFRIKFTATRNHLHAVCLESDFKAGRIKIQKRSLNSLKGDSWVFLTPRGSLMQAEPARRIKPKEEAYEGMVYCVTVSTGQFMARSKGLPFIAGNCDAARYWLMNVFATKGIARLGGKRGIEGPDARELAGRKLFREILQDHGAVDSAEEGEGKGGSGGFKWNI